MGYYPTPLSVVNTIAQWISVPDAPYRILDPCCGEGLAVSHLASILGGQGETWGVELSPGRAQAASGRLDRVIQGDWFNVQVTEKSISLLYLNPPYDHDGEDRRMEIAFLRQTLDTLVPGGVLVYIVPQRLLGYEIVAKMLAGYFENLVSRRFPDGEYERFHQVVVFGVRRSRYQKPDGDTVDAIRALANADLPVLDEPESPWPVTLPPAPGRAKMVLVEMSNYERICQAAAMGWPPELLDTLNLSERSTTLQPAMPLKRGHVAMLMSSGLQGLRSG